MAYTPIYRGSAPNAGDGDTAYVFTGKVNTMFSELYGISVIPVKLDNQTGSFTITIPENTWVERILVLPESGVPDVKIGTTLHGTEICDTVQIGNSLPILVQQYFTNETTIYVEVSGGNVFLRIDQINPLK